MNNLTLFDGSQPPSKKAAAFTLPEALIALTVFLMLLGGIVTANLFGMRMFQLAETKLNATDGTRKALGLMADEIRKCKCTWIGNVTNGVFASQLDGELQIGSALLIQSSTDTNSFVYYFLNPSDQSFRRYVTLTSKTSILAQSITNSGIFRAQDCFGNVLTNAQNNRVIHATLQFFQAQPWLPTPDYFCLETSVTRRKLE